MGFKKYHFALLSCLFLGTINLSAQSFPWFGGEREPYQIPTLYLGITGSYSFMSTSDLITLQVPQSIFVDGNSISDAYTIDFSLSTEYWLEYNQAIRTDFGIATNSLTTERIFSEAYRGGQWEQMNTMDRNEIFLTLDVQYKYRLYDFLSALAGIKNQISLSSSLDHRLISLDSELSYNNNQDTEITLSPTQLVEWSDYQSEIILGINYDIPIVMGIYASPTLTIGYRWGWDNGNPAFFTTRLGTAVYYGVN